MTDSEAEVRAAAVAAALVVPLVVAAVLLRTGHWPLQGVDHSVALWLYDSPVGVDGRPFWRWLGNATQTWAIDGGFVLLIGWMIVRRRLRIAIWVAVAGLVQLVGWPLVKVLVDRPRPHLGAYVFHGSSFPSGHSSGIATLIGVTIVLTRHGVARRGRRRVLIGCWLAVGLLVGLDRIFVGAHYPSDVVGGWLVGAFVVFASAVAFGVVSFGRPETAPRSLSSVPDYRRTLAVVVHPVKVGDVDAFRTRVSKAVRSAGWDEPLWFETSVNDAGRAMTRAAIAAGADIVLAAGGDGTVRVICGELAGTGIPIGILPLGTGNLLARNLALPLFIEAALDVALHGQDRAIDIVRVEGDALPQTHYVVMGGLGLDAAIMDGAPDVLKARMGWPAYAVSALRQFRYPAMKVDISVDGAPPVAHRARTVVVGNVGTLQARIPLLPDALVDDGLLDVVVIAPRHVTGWLGLVYRVMLRRRRTDDRLNRLTGRRVAITAGHPIPRQLDGDSVGAGRELRCEVQAGRLLVRVPR